MKRSEIQIGDVLAWMPRYTTPRYQDQMSEPVRIIELDREKPVFAHGRMGAGAKPHGTRKVIIGVRLDPITFEPWPPTHMRSGEIEIVPKNCTGLWYDRVERMRTKAQHEREATAEAEARAARNSALWVEAKALFVRPEKFSASLDSRGRVSMPVEDFLAVIKSARTQALDEMEGTGGRNV